MPNPIITPQERELVASYARFMLADTEALTQLTALINRARQSRDAKPLQPAAVLDAYFNDAPSKAPTKPART